VSLLADRDFFRQDKRAQWDHPDRVKHKGTSLVQIWMHRKHSDDNAVRGACGYQDRHNPDRFPSHFQASSLEIVTA